MKIKPIIAILVIVIAIFAGGITYFFSTNKNSQVTKNTNNVKKEEVAKVVKKKKHKKEEVKKEEVVEVQKEVQKKETNNIAIKPFKPVKLNVHLQDFNEDFICYEATDRIYSCKKEEKKATALDEEKKTYEEKKADARKLELEISLVKLIPNGKFSIKENNNVIIEGNYVHGFINGEVKKYFSNGEIEAVENYKSGLLDGNRIVYNRNESGSILRQEQNWNVGFLDGVFVKNDPDGNFFRKVQFSNGEFKGELKNDI